MANVELADAYVSIIPSAKGFKTKLAREIEPDLEKAGRDGGDAAADAFEDSFTSGVDGDGIGSKLGGLLKGGMLAGGAVAGAAVVAGFNEAFGDQSIVTGFELELGVGADVAEALGKATSAAYASGLGESKEEVAAAAAAVNTAFGDSIDYDPATLQPLIEQATAVADVFDTDVNEAMMASGSLLRNGLVADGQEGLDLLAKGLQGLAPAVRDEVLAATNEYGKHFAALGISGEEAFRLFRASDGVIGVDKLGDALKELTIRSTDMSKGTIDAYSALGLNAQEMTERMLAGGDTARGAMDEIVESLLGVTDPADQAGLAIALFGTPLEDLGTDQVPGFLKSLTHMEGGLGDIDGAAQKMADGLTSGPMAKLEAFKRQGLQTVADFIGGTVIPGIEKLVSVFQEGGLSGVLDLVSSKFSEAWPKIQQTLTDLIGKLGSWIAEQVPVLAGKLVEWAGAFVEWIVPMIPTALQELGKLLGSVAEWIIDEGLPMLVEKLTEWATSFVAWVGPQIPPLLLELGKLLLSVADWIITDALPKLVGKLGEWAGAFIGWVAADAIPGLIRALGDLHGAISRWFAEEAIPMAAEKTGDLVNGILGWFTGLPGMITELASGMFDGIWQAFKSAINLIIDAWNGLEFTIPKAEAFGVSIGGGTIGVPDIPRLHQGGRVPGGPGDEHLYLLEGGETVRTREQEADLRSGGGITVNANGLTLDEAIQFVPRAIGHQLLTAVPN